MNKLNYSYNTIINIEKIGFETKNIITLFDILIWLLLIYLNNSKQKLKILS